MAKKISDLPMDELISGPLIAAFEDPTMLDIADKSGGDQKKKRLLEFEVEHSAKNVDGLVGHNAITVEAPLSGLIPIPDLPTEDLRPDSPLEAPITKPTN